MIGIFGYRTIDFQELGINLGSFIYLIIANNYFVILNFLNMIVSFQGSVFCLIILMVMICWKAILVGHLVN
jgi:hypothetical protein